MPELMERLTNTAYYCGEYLTMKLAGEQPPRGWRGRLFRFPILLYRWRLDGIVARRILLLRTVGRRTGKTRVTPLEYLYDDATDTFYLMAGWGGHTDWLRNLREQPRVRIRVGRREYARTALFLDPADGGPVLQRWIEQMPVAVGILEKDTGVRYDGTVASATELASHYATVGLPP
jgi:deazaflavin-dependent oxidoreductase (nitroreductase family)